MAAGPDPAEVIGVEQRVLRVLCQGTPEGSIRETARMVLRGYRWRELMHQVIFDILLSIPTEMPGVIQSQLPARLTRRGFPDVDIDDFFQPHGMSKKHAEELMQFLRDSG
jgi:hypothetical protein